MAGTIPLGLVGLAFIFLGFKMLYENYGRTISETNRIKGLIKSVSLEEKSSRIGAYPFIYLKSKSLAIELQSSNKKFKIYIPSQEYESVIEILKINKEVKIYYNSSIQPEIYQLEIRDKVVIDINDYNLRHSVSAIIIILCGAIFIVLILWVLKKNNWG